MANSDNVLDLSLFRGATFHLGFLDNEYEDNVLVGPADLSGSVIRAYFRDVYGDELVLATDDASPTDGSYLAFETNGTDGLFNLHLSATTNLGLVKADGDWRIMRITGPNDAEILVRGAIRVNASVEGGEI